MGQPQDEKSTAQQRQAYAQRCYPSPKSLPSPDVAQFQEFANLPIPPLVLDPALLLSSGWQGEPATASTSILPTSILPPSILPPTIITPATTQTIARPITQTTKPVPRATTRVKPRRHFVMSEYFHHAGSSRSGDVYGLDFRRSRSIHTDTNLELTGPLDVAGTIKARSIHFDGDFIVSDTIDAYGNIDIQGNMTAEGRMKAFGDITIKGNLTASAKIKGSARLKLQGNIQATDVEIYGNVMIRGYLSCRQLTVYGSVILIGPNSTYDVAESEMIAGLCTRRDHEPDWDI